MWKNVRPLINLKFLPRTSFTSSNNFTKCHRRFASSSPSQLPPEALTSSSTIVPKDKENAPSTLRVTERCKQRLRQILEKKGSFLRVFVEGGGCSGFQYKFEIDDQMTLDDIIVHADEESVCETQETFRNLVPAKIVIDSESLKLLKGSELDYETELIRSSFRILNNPKAIHGCSCGASFNLNM